MGRELSTETRTSTKTNIVLFYKRHVRRPIVKMWRKKVYQTKELFIGIALSRLVYQFRPLMIGILDEALRNYHEAMKQNHYTVQAQHDIRKFYEIALDTYTKSIE